MEIAEKLADDHWEWVEMLLESFKNIEIGIDTLAFVYISAFVHGYKHGEESKINDNQEVCCDRKKPRFGGVTG